MRACYRPSVACPCARGGETAWPCGKRASPRTSLLRVLGVLVLAVGDNELSSDTASNWRTVPERTTPEDPRFPYPYPAANGVTSRSIFSPLFIFVVSRS